MQRVINVHRLFSVGHSTANKMKYMVQAPTQSELKNIIDQKFKIVKTFQLIFPDNHFKDVEIVNLIDIYELEYSVEDYLSLIKYMVFRGDKVLSVFEKMVQLNGVTVQVFEALFRELIKVDGDVCDVFYLKMKEMGIEPSAEIALNVFSSACKRNDVDKMRLYKEEFEESGFVITVDYFCEMISLYARLHRGEDITTAYEEAIGLFTGSDKAKLMSFICEIYFSSGKAVEAYPIINNAKTDEEIFAVQSVLLEHHLKRGDSASAEKVLDYLRAKNIDLKNIQILTLIIENHLRGSEEDAAMNILQKMGELNLSPNVRIYSSFIKYFLRQQNIHSAESMLGELAILGINPNAEILKELIGYYAINQNVRRVEELLGLLDVPLDVNLISSLITMYSDLDDIETVKDYLLIMNKLNIRPNRRLMISLTKIFNGLKEDFNDYLDFDDKEFDETKTLSLIQISVQKGDERSALRHFERFKSKPNSYAYSLIFGLYSQKGDIEGILRTYSRMKNDNVLLDESAYLSLLNVFISKDDYMNALTIYSDIKSSGIEMNVKSLDEFLDPIQYLSKLQNLENPEIPVLEVLIDIFLDQKNEEKAVECFTLIKENNFLNSNNASKLISYFCGQKNYQLVDQIYSDLTKFGIAPSIDIFDSIISMYSTEGNAEKELYFLKKISDYNMSPSDKICTTVTKNKNNTFPYFNLD